MSNREVGAAPNTGWRHRLGLLLFFGAFPIFTINPVVIPIFGFSAGESAALIGGVLLVVELHGFASIPLLGKAGFQQVKEQAVGKPTKPGASPVWRCAVGGQRRTNSFASKI